MELAVMMHAEQITFNPAVIFRPLARHLRHMWRRKKIMITNGWLMILALGAATLPAATTQSARPADDATAFQTPQSKSAGSNDNDKVTTDDTVLKPGDPGYNDQSKKTKSRKAPKSPPNPPVAAPEQNPSSPSPHPKTPAGAPAPK
ncbi:MAG TPA: hypothetical protein VG297_00350 [Bryobacteraceae bacterium]|nr:hypothetical protein [Bryobacteraceae bacterium]